MTKDIKLLKMVTGEDLIAEVVVEDDFGNLLIKNPIRVILVPQRPGGDAKAPTVAFAPWGEFAQDGSTITIDKRHIIAMMTPIKEFIGQYNSIFSKVIMPQAKLFVPGE
jgi:hypothetical protein